MRSNMTQVGLEFVGQCKRYPMLKALYQLRSSRAQP